MPILSVHTGSPYDIHLGRGLLPLAGAKIRECVGGESALIVTDSHVGPLYAQTLSRSLTEAGFTRVTVFTFPAGEQSKQLTTVAHLYAALAAAEIDRHGLIVALGGGVTGDMAGFAAATWMRGIPFVQIPTSLLAMVDSSIGGKTGVDIPEGKNLVGAFWQPALVLADLSLLETLPREFFTDGLGEVVKSACIRDGALFSLLEADGADADLCETVRRCMEIKRAVVEADERETGERKLLNFGHTLGHALERQLNYTGISHGRAVAAGMAIVTGASERAGLTERGTYERLCALLRALGLPTGCDVPTDVLLEQVRLDKKCIGGEVDLVILKTIGEAACVRLPLSSLPGFFKV